MFQQINDLLGGLYCIDRSFKSGPSFGSFDSYFQNLIGQVFPDQFFTDLNPLRSIHRLSKPVLANVKQQSHGYGLCWFNTLLRWAKESGQNSFAGQNLHGLVQDSLCCWKVLPSACFDSAILDYIENGCTKGTVLSREYFHFLEI
ncbi:MAG: hypothetical protein HKM06_08650 [Spirochaetales bacterium]|nr:hypothetical protein [Spirochaetales bacterium]